MAKKKRVTLPKAFNELIEAGDTEALIALYTQCDLNATYDGRFGLNTALHHRDVPIELIFWLAEQGADINARNYYGQTPLHAQAACGGEAVKALVDLGGDLNATDKDGGTPLHAAARYFRADTVRLLVEKGANITARNARGQSALAVALSACRNIDIPQAAEISAELLQAGEAVTPDMLENVKRIGQEFEFHRERFSKERLAEVDAGLERLYSLFNVTPVAQRRVHDGASPIVVAEDPWREQYEALWNLLVPSSGPATTMQGEVIRIAGRVHDEIRRNGGVNWDQDYRLMLSALEQHFASGTPLADDKLKEARTLIAALSASGSSGHGATERLCELSVLWVAANPMPIVLEAPAYTR